MKKVKQGICILFFFGLMLCIAAAPTLVTDYYNGRLLNSVTLRELPEESASTMGLREKLEIVRRAAEAGTFYRDDYTYSVAYGLDMDAQMGKLLETELAKLLSGMQLEIKGFEGVYSEKFIYLDRDGAGTPVEIWRIAGETPEYYVTAYMDAETGMICQLFLHSLGMVFSKQAPERLRQSAREYLDLALDGGQAADGGWLDVEVNIENYYKWMEMTLCGYEPGTDTIVPYDLERMDTVMDVMDADAYPMARDVKVYEW